MGDPLLVVLGCAEGKVGAGGGAIRSKFSTCGQQPSSRWHLLRNSVDALLRKAESRRCARCAKQHDRRRWLRGSGNREAAQDAGAGIEEHMRPDILSHDWISSLML